VAAQLTPPEGRWVSTVRLGPKSQIVIPKEVRDIFGLEPGDSLLLFADRERGIALVNPAEYSDVMDRVLGSHQLRSENRA